MLLLLFLLLFLLLKFRVQSFPDKEARSHRLKTCFICLFEESDTVLQQFFLQQWAQEKHTDF